MLNALAPLLREVVVSHVKDWGGGVWANIWPPSVRIKLIILSPLIAQVGKLAPCPKGKPQ